MNPLSSSRRRRAEAAAWFARLNRPNVVAADLQAFAKWRDRPGAEQAFSQVRQAWRRAGALHGDPTTQRLLADALTRRRPFDTRARWACAAAVVAMIAVAPLLFGGRAWTAPPAARRGVTLPDGSRVLLDGGSTLETRWLWGARHVRLARGEALFEVAHDPRRPFYVDAGPTIIVARGTRFDVLRLSQTTRVVLLRGVVDVWDQQSLSHIHRLAPDQSIATGAHKPSPIDPQRVLDWTRGRIRFDHAPVGEAVELMERHSDTPLRLTPAAQASPLRLSGEFSEGDVAGFVDALRALTGWSARKDADGVLALGPDETSQTSS